MRMFLSTLALACGWYALASDDTSDRHPAADTLKLVSFNHGTALDLSPLGQTATVGASVTFPSRVADFAGDANSVVSWPDLAALETPPFSAAMWVRIDTYTGVRQLLGKCTTATTYEGWTFYIGPGITRGLSLLQIDSSVVPATTNYAAHWTATGALSASTWTHVGFSLASLGATPVLYINGAAATITGSASAGTVASFANTTTLRVGGQGSPDTTGYLDGALDGLLVVSRVLSANEFATHYAEGLGVTRP